MKKVQIICVDNNSHFEKVLVIKKKTFPICFFSNLCVRKRKKNLCGVRIRK